MSPAERSQMIAIASQAEALELMAQGLRKQVEAILVGSPGLPSIVARDAEKPEERVRHYGSKTLSRTDLEAVIPTTST